MVVHHSKHLSFTQLIMFPNCIFALTKSIQLAVYLNTSLNISAKEWNTWISQRDLPGFIWSSGSTSLRWQFVKSIKKIHGIHEATFVSRKYTYIGSLNITPKFALLLKRVSSYKACHFFHDFGGYEPLYDLVHTTFAVSNVKATHQCRHWLWAACT